MSIGELTNPFNVWAELAIGLRDRFLAELGTERPQSPAYADEVLGQLAGMITLNRRLSVSLQRMQQNEPKAYDAFLGALERS